MTTRRNWLMVFGASALAAPLACFAQQGKVPRIGTLRSGSSSDASSEGLKEGLRELGHVEGRNLAIENRWAEGRDENLPGLAADLAGLKVEVIVATGGAAALAAKQATSAIPIVMLVGGDPVEIGLVASLARPGGNVTGLSAQSDALPGKWLELLKETVPKLARVAVLRDPAVGKSLWNASQSAAQSLGLSLQPLEVKRADDYAAAFAEARKHSAQALVVLGAGLHFANRARIVELAARHRLPVMYPTQAYVADLEGLMSYGPDSYALGRRAATYVDKVLKGARPADLPVEQPTKFELVINMKAAKTIGLKIPQSVLARADRVIE